jgi:hypothetical protein
MPASLSIDALIQVSVNLSPAAAQAQNTSVELVLGNSPVIDTVTRIRYYTTLAGVAADFGTSAPEYLAAQLWFAQVPQPTEIAIGRWAQTATPGALLCGVLEPAQLLLSYWTAITTGSFHVSIDGTGHDILGLNFSAALSLNGVAAVIQAGLVSAFGGTPTCVYNAEFERFEIYSGTTGTSSSVSFLTAAASGTDISGPMEGLSSDASSGAYLVPGLAAESAVSAATLFDNMFGQTWYALLMPTITTDSDHVAVAGYIEASGNKHIYGITTSEGAIISNPADTTNIAYLIKTGKYNRTYVQYSSTNAYAISSAFARILTTNYGGNNTVITLMYKQEPIVVAENLTATQLATLQSFNANVFAAYNNNTAILESFVSGSGIYADVLIGSDNFAIQLQTDIYNLLYLSPTKIPQTDAGTHQITTVIKNDCVQYVDNGFIAPGVWNVGGFGQLKQGDFMATGFYIYAPSVNTQNPTDRAARKSVPIQVAIKLAGAVQTVNLQVTVNQ